MAQVVEFFRWQIDQISYFWHSVISGNPMTNLAQEFCLILIAKKREQIKNSEIDNLLKEKVEGLIDLDCRLIYSQMIWV